MRILSSIIPALIMLFFLGCSNYMVQANTDSPQDEHIDINRQDYETHTQSSVPRIDSLGIWECYIESYTNSSCKFYFDNGKLKKWGH